MSALLGSLHGTLRHPQALVLTRLAPPTSGRDACTTLGEAGEAEFVRDRKSAGEQRKEERFFEKSERFWVEAPSLRGLDNSYLLLKCRS